MSKIQRFSTSDGRDIFQLPVEAFPGFIVNLYLILGGDRILLVDCGSGTETSRQQILQRFEELKESFGLPVSLADVERILITHGHIDHFGGLRWAKEISGAEAAVHILDRRVLSHYEERVVVASKALASFLERSGVEAPLQASLMQMYLWAKGRYRSTPVEHLLQEGEPAAEGIQVLHVPGHCPGQVCLRVGDVLLTADHVLARITPNQAPEAITQYTGLGHYFESLEKVSRLDGIRLGLGGHEEPIPDVAGRAQAIRRLHEQRLEKVLAICREPKSTSDISHELFGPRKSYHVLLALIETGAHVEYLYQRGLLSAENWREIERETNPVIRYCRS